MEKAGKISVLMGVRNCEATLSDAIESLLHQTYSDWELILCDDASQDATLSICEAYQKRYSDRIVVLKNDKHEHLAFTLNRCLQAASGEFVARMDGDDRSLPDRFERQVAFLKSHRDIVLVGTAMQRVYDDGSYGAIAYCPEFPDRFTPLHSNVFNHATVLAYKRVYDALGGYTVCKRTERGQDKDLWFRFLHAGYRGANLQEPLYLVREDIGAIKRRTAHDRWIGVQTKLYGYRLLRYPWYRYPKLFFELLKIFVPSRVILWYRKYQKKREQDRRGASR